MFGVIGLTVRRAREERLAQVAGSLTFTSVLAAVPLLAVGFAVFAHVPGFRRLGALMQEQLVAGLLPADLARAVLRHLARFAANAGGLTGIGSVFLLLSAVALLLTVENAFNRMWRVKKPRPLLQRLALYLLALAFGPPLLGASVWATSYLLAASAGLARSAPPWVALALNFGPALLAAAGLAALFYFVPNARVRRRDALVGGLLAGIAFELGKRGFAAYLQGVPTYRTVYGAFAVLPAFLLWVYFSWLVLLGAALVTANLARAGGAAERRPARAR